MPKQKPTTTNRRWRRYQRDHRGNNPVTGQKGLSGRFRSKEMERTDSSLRNRMDADKMPYSSPDSRRTMIEAALQYAGRGCRVIPCRSDKVPRIRNWQVAASSDPETIIDWWTQWPNAWIALL